MLSPFLHYTTVLGKQIFGKKDNNRKLQSRRSLQADPISALATLVDETLPVLESISVKRRHYRC